MRRALLFFVRLLLTAGRSVRAEEVNPGAATLRGRRAGNVTNQPWTSGRSAWQASAVFALLTIGTVLTGIMRAGHGGTSWPMPITWNPEAAEGGQQCRRPWRSPITRRIWRCSRPMIASSSRRFSRWKWRTAHTGDVLSVWQLENNGALLRDEVRPMTTAEVTRYPVDEVPPCSSIA